MVQQNKISFPISKASAMYVIEVMNNTNIPQKIWFLNTTLLDQLLPGLIFLHKNSNQDIFIVAIWCTQ